MNRLKALFVPLWITVVVIILVTGVLRLVTQAFSVAWLGASITAVSIQLFFLNLYMLQEPRLKRRLPGWTTAVFLGLLLALVGQFSPNSSPGALVGTAVITVGWLLYVYWYSQLERNPDTPLTVGKPLPDFVVEDEAGREVHSRDWHGQPSLLMFYRGNWCPLCMVQIQEIAANYRELAQRGVQVILISPQPHARTRDLAHKFEIPMRFLVDVGNRAARRLKIEHANGLPAGMELLGYESETVLPTMLVTDENGRILHLDLTDNYRLRPDPTIFLQALDQHIT